MAATRHRGNRDDSGQSGQHVLHTESGILIGKLVLQEWKESESFGIRSKTFINQHKIFNVTHKSQDKNVFCFKSCIDVLSCVILLKVCMCSSLRRLVATGEKKRASNALGPPQKVNHSYKEQDLSGGIEMWQAGETNNSAKTMIWQHDCQGQFN